MDTDISRTLFPSSTMQAVLPRFLLVASLGAGLLRAAEPAPAPAPPAAAAAAPSVHTVTPAKAAASSTYTIPGRTEPIESARIFTRATGIVKERRYDIGDRVKAGDILAVIDTPDLDRAVESSRAAVEQAQVRANNARALAQRSGGLFEARAISQEESDQRAADAGTTSAALRVAQADLSKLEEQQKFATVRAPFDATVAARNFDRGDRVRGDAATAEGWLYQLVRLNSLRFTVNAAPDLALRLTAETEAKVRFGEFPGKTFPAKLARTSRIFDPGVGTMRVELLLDNADLTLPAGLTGTATFNLPPAPGMFIVPNNTLISRAGQTLLAVVDGGKVAFIEVRAGRNLGPTVEVSSAALSAQTKVIVNPNGMLRAGDAVTVAESSPAK